jgi:GDPmannose 4,6-dehydratase
VSNNILITGVTGQTGSYLTDLSLEMGYNVIGVHRRSSSRNFWRLARSINHHKFSLVEGDLTDSSFINNIVRKYQPIYIFNTAAQSHVGSSFNQPEYTFDVNTKGVLNLLEAVRNYSINSRFLQASTSEMFGNNYSIDKNDNKIQNENTAFHPDSPYAISKLAAHNLVVLYRKAYNLHASCSISMNHESPRRSKEFVTRKITDWLYRFNEWREERPLCLLDCNDSRYIYCNDGGGFFPKLELGNIYSCRDWGYALDYCEAFFKIVEYNTPDDYVVATGHSYSVEDFLKKAFNIYNLNYSDFIQIDSKLMRPVDVQYLRGDPSKIYNKLGWKATTNLDTLIQLMLDNENGKD